MLHYVGTHLGEVLTQCCAESKVVGYQFVLRALNIEYDSGDTLAKSASECG